jgi:hypothetical protein
LTHLAGAALSALPRPLPDHAIPSKIGENTPSFPARSLFTAGTYRPYMFFVKRRLVEAFSAVEKGE